MVDIAILSGSMGQPDKQINLYFWAQAVEENWKKEHERKQI